MSIWKRRQDDLTESSNLKQSQKDLARSSEINVYPKLNEAKIALSYCAYLKKQYANMPLIIEVPNVSVLVDDDNVKEIPFMEGFLESEGLPVTKVIPYEEEVEKPMRGVRINNEKVELLNYAVSLNCQWAVAELEWIKNLLKKSN
ncbi:MAG: hypothetical protein ABIK92_12715 [Pseudomonadota bacterium]